MGKLVLAVGQTGKHEAKEHTLWSRSPKVSLHPLLLTILTSLARDLGEMRTQSLPRVKYHSWPAQVPEARDSRTVLPSPTTSLRGPPTMNQPANRQQTP